MRGQAGLWGVPSVLLLGTTALGGGCGLVLNYGDFGGAGGATASAASTGSANGGASTSASAGGGTSSTSSTTSGTMASGSSSASSAGGTQCSGQCQATLAGWTPVLYYHGNAAPPPCPEGPVLFDGGTGATALPASCTSCACGTPACDSPYKIDLWASDKTCAATATTSVMFAPTDCVTLPIMAVAIEIEKPASSSPASGGAATIPAATWSVHHETCTPTAEICPPDETCLESAPTGFKSCLSSAPGSAPVTCPAGYNQSVFSTGFADKRGCSPCKCSCDACTDSLFAYQTGCPGVAATGPEPFGSCVTGVVSSTAFLKIATQPVPPSSCTPSAVAPTGSVADGTSLVTVCCPM